MLSTSSCTRSSARSAVIRSWPSTSAARSTPKRSWPAGTGVCVVKTQRSRTRLEVVVLCQREDEQCRMPFVHVVRADAIVERAQHCDRAEAEQRLLLEPVARVAAVEPPRQRASAVVVLVAVGVEEEDRHDAVGADDVVSPYSGDDRTARDREGDRGGQRFEMIVDPPALRLLVLQPACIEMLAEVALAVEQRDGDHRVRGVGRRPDDIAREHAQSAAVGRHVGGNGDLHRHVSDQRLSHRWLVFAVFTNFPYPRPARPPRPTIRLCTDVRRGARRADGPVAPLCRVVEPAVHGKRGERAQVGGIAPRRRAAARVRAAGRGRRRGPGGSLAAVGRPQCRDVCGPGTGVERERRQSAAIGEQVGDEPRYASVRRRERTQPGQPGDRACDRERSGLGIPEREPADGRLGLERDHPIRRRDCAVGERRQVPRPPRAGILADPAHRQAMERAQVGGDDRRRRCRGARPSPRLRHSRGRSGIRRAGGRRARDRVRAARGPRSRRAGPRPSGVEPATSSSRSPANASRSAAEGGGRPGPRRRGRQPATRAVQSRPFSHYWTADREFRRPDRYDGRWRTIWRRSASAFSSSTGRWGRS